MARVGSWLMGIVILIALVIAAFFGWNAMQNKSAGPQAPAASISDMRSLNTALHTYQSKYGHYPDTLQDLAVAANGPSSEHGAGLIGSKLAGGSLHGYRFTYAKRAQGYYIHGEPTDTENKVHLFTDESLEVKFELEKPAGPDSIVVQ
jgi:type II secretory pathway pseudopilin PulG